MNDVVLLGAFELAFSNWQMELDRTMVAVESQEHPRREKRRRRGGERGGPFVYFAGRAWAVVGGNGAVRI